MPTRKVPVSVLIPIRNEAGNLPRCLASIAWADEVFVVDSQSTDGSEAIARAAGAQVVQFHYDGMGPKKKNWALANLPFRHAWVFILDADEVMPATAADEFAALLAEGGRGCAGFWINRRFMFMGRWLRHAYYPNWNLRLFQHRLGRYETLVAGDTRSGDNEVHEHIVLAGSAGRLRCEMDHHAFPSVEVFIEKHNRYSNWEAHREVQERSAPSQGATHLAHTGLRRRLKTWARHLPFRPSLRFLYIYVLQAGFLDGRRGYYFARLHATYELLTLAKAAELRLQRSRPPASAAIRTSGTATAQHAEGRAAKELRAAEPRPRLDQTG